MVTQTTVMFGGRYGLRLSVTPHRIALDNSLATFNTQGYKTFPIPPLMQCRLYLHWGPGHPPAERGPSLESIYRVSLTVDICER